MPAFNPVPIDSTSIAYDTLSYCHWDSAVLARPDGARFHAENRPHSILNLGDSSIVDNLNDNLYYLKEGHYKLIYTPTFLKEYEIRQIAVYKNTFQSDTIDSTFYICALSSFDSIKYQLPWNLECSIENSEDSINFSCDSNLMFHLPQGNYIIRIFDTAHCQMRVTNLSVVLNNADTLITDSTIVATDWTSSGLTAITKVAFYPSLNGMNYSMMNMADSSMLPDTSAMLYLHAGNYQVKVIDTSNCQVIFTNLTVAVDTPQLESMDTTVYFCQFGDSSVYRYDTLYNYLPLSIHRIEPTADTMTSNFLQEGIYVVKYFDTLSGYIYQTNLTVSANNIDYDTVSKSISYCNWSAYGFDTLDYYGLGYTIYYDSLPHLIISGSDTLSNDTLIVGSYLVKSYDFNNCKQILTNLTVTSDTSGIVVDDSTMSYCKWDSTGINAQSFVSYYTPYITPRVTIVKTSPTSETMQTNQLTEGDYTITVYAIYECTRFVTHLTVNGTDPDVETLDTALSYCNISEWSGTNYTITDSLPYSFIRTSPTVDSSLSNFLSAGSYTIRHYDTSHCRIIQTNLTVTALDYDTAYATDTISYSCSNDSSVVYIRPCTNGVIKDKWENTLGTEGSDLFNLNPHNGYYTSYCVDTANCMVNKLHLTFYDLIEVPFETDDTTFGTFDRKESDSCCFVNIDNLSCATRELVENDEIEIFSIVDDDTIPPTFLLKTTIQPYGATHVLGFKFCPPQWDVSEEHINDWYTIVMKKDTCDFCRFDFMCDSTVEFYAMAPALKYDYTGKINNHPNQKTFPNTTKVANAEGGMTSITVFPNPSSNEVNVKIRNILENNIKLNIYDNTGKQVFTNLYNAQKDLSIKINMSAFASGVYTINIPELNYNFKLVLIK